jgi:IclR family acetate operon transcriptional repressor
VDEFSHNVSTTDGGRSVGSQAVDRAASILILVAESADPPTITTLASEIRLSPSTTSRIANALLRRRLLARDDRGRLHPGIALLHLAKRGGLLGQLLAEADESLDRVARATGETVTLAVPDGGAVQHLAQRQTRHAIGAIDWVGQTVPAHHSSTGKVFLASGALPRPARLERATNRTIVRFDELDQELELVRNQGFAVTRDELEVGLVAAAAPISDRSTGRVIAALSVSGPSSRLTRTRTRAVCRLLTLEASDLSTRMSRVDHGTGATMSRDSDES